MLVCLILRISNPKSMSYRFESEAFQGLNVGPAAFAYYNFPAYRHEHVQSADGPAKMSRSASLDRVNGCHCVFGVVNVKKMISRFHCWLVFLDEPPFFLFVWLRSGQGCQCYGRIELCDYILNCGRFVGVASDVKSKSFKVLTRLTLFFVFPFLVFRYHDKLRLGATVDLILLGVVKYQVIYAL